jgi:hypothetical protein
MVQEEQDQSPEPPLFDNSQARLIISEVYYDNDEERIELHNAGSGNFYGNLTLSGEIF